MASKEGGGGGGMNPRRDLWSLSAAADHLTGASTAPEAARPRSRARDLYGGEGDVVTILSCGNRLRSSIQRRLRLFLPWTFRARVRTYKL